jgi:diketogulonate reductase-like aldo/keto reductase
MTRQVETHEIDMELAEIPGTSLKVSRVAIGTWAIGGWMWGGTDEAQSVSTIRAALEHGINLIDTAPVYGFGRSEEIVGKAIAEGGLRSRVLIATKAGLEWQGGRVSRNASRARILREIEDSLRRLRTDHIDIYQVHWPDPLVAVEETADAMHMLLRQGKIRAIGVSNFSVGQMERFRRVAPLHVLQPPYNLFERGIEADLLPYCRRNNITSRRWAMARCVEASCPDECAQIPFSTATICDEPTRSSWSPDSRNIWPPCKGSIDSPQTVSASASFSWPSAGCSIKVSPLRYGARVVPISCRRSTT